MLAELALYGTFVILPEVLHYRRMSADSATPHRTKEMVWEMIRPGQKCRLFVPESRRLFGYFQTLAFARTGLGEKLHSLSGLARKLYHMRGHLWSELMENWRGSSAFRCS